MRQKFAKETTRKRKANKSFIVSRKISNSTKIITNMSDTIDNKTKCLMYALNLTKSYHKLQIQQILNQLNQFKIESTIDSNSTVNANASSKSNSNANVSANAKTNQKINSDIDMKNTQIEQNNQ